jgi:RNA-directed DNA polymerase
VRIVNETLDELKVEQHPDKTFVGRISRGFEFLGYAITTPGIVGVAKKTLERFVERVTRLYEQGADPDRIADYVRRWRVWVISGVRGVVYGDVGTNCRRSCRCRADSM